MITGTFRGAKFEADLTTGFTVYNQDGSSYVQVRVKDVRIIDPPPSGGGEPLPVPRSA